MIVRLVDPHDGKVVRGVDGAPKMVVKVRTRCRSNLEEAL